ncbi:MAG: hypothetical protein AAF268_11610 [Cyanobacteria bacterium P01_A01_bin.3]
MKNSPAWLSGERGSLSLPAETQFSSLWRPWDFIEAPIPQRTQRPAWNRITQYPLVPGLLLERWESTKTVVGTSFGDRTSYCLVDIDRDSQYHPYSNEAGFNQVLGTLETVGLTRPLIVRSSASEGLHVYYPLPAPVSTWKLANLLANTCQQTQLTVRGGQLELFPNVKAWVPSGSGFSHYQAHRLPLQQGSVLLDSDLLPDGADLTRFMFRWHGCAEGQAFDQLTEALATTKAKSHRKRGSQKAQQYRRDLQSTIERGWTGPTQTNDLLSRIARLGYIFLHKSGKALVEYMVSVAQQLPGYEAFCRHQHQLLKRCREWARAIEKSPTYFPYREQDKPSDLAKRPLKVPPNPERKTNALSRLKQIVECLEANGTLEPHITPRAKQLAAQGFSQETLYKDEYKSLWHPKHYQPSVIPGRASALAITQNLSPEPEQAETAAESGITDASLRSVGSAGGLQEIKETRPEGGAGGTEPELYDPDSLVCQLVALAGWQGHSVFKRLVPGTSPEKVRQVMAAYREQDARSSIRHPVAWLATALRGGWSSNPNLSRHRSPTPMVSLPSDQCLPKDSSLPIGDSSPPVPMPEWIGEQIRTKLLGG